MVSSVCVHRGGQVSDILCHRAGSSGKPGKINEQGTFNESGF